MGIPGSGVSQPIEQMSKKKNPPNMGGVQMPRASSFAISENRCVAPAASNKWYREINAFRNIQFGRSVGLGSPDACAIAPAKSGALHHKSPLRRSRGRVGRAKTDIARQVCIPIDREQGRGGRFAPRGSGDKVREGPVSVGLRDTKGVALGRTLVRTR